MNQASKEMAVYTAVGPVKYNSKLTRVNIKDEKKKQNKMTAKKLQSIDATVLTRSNLQKR